MLDLTAAPRPPAQGAEEVLAAAAGPDPICAAAATRAIHTATTALGVALGWLVNVLDPAAVVVGGGLGSAQGPYWDALVAATRAHIWSPVSRTLPIVQATLGPDAGLIGAALAGVLAGNRAGNRAGDRDLTRAPPP
jgi:glucokinase